MLRGGSGLWLIVSVLFGSGAASAAGLPGHSGTFGRHYLADNQDNPGVTCRYASANNFRGVSVASPFVYAADRTAGVDSQTVGWAIRVVEKTNATGATWHPIYTSSVQTAVATDRRDAAFTRRAHTFNVGRVPTSSIYRVQVLMTWYTGSWASGNARHAVEWYRGLAFDSFGPNGYCPGFQF